MIAFEGEAVGRSLGHEGGALINGINVQIKGTPESFLPLFSPYEDTRKSQQFADQKWALTRTPLC